MAINKYAKMQKSYEEELAKTRAELNAQKAKFDALSKAGTTKGSIKKAAGSTKKATNTATKGAAMKKTSTTKKSTRPTGAQKLPYNPNNPPKIQKLPYNPNEPAKMQKLPHQIAKKPTTGAVTGGVGKKIAKPLTNTTAKKLTGSNSLTSKRVAGAVGTPAYTAAAKHNVMNTTASGATIKKPTATKKNEWQ